MTGDSTRQFNRITDNRNINVADLPSEQQIANTASDGIYFISTLDGNLDKLRWDVSGNFRVNLFFLSVSFNGGVLCCFV